MKLKLPLAFLFLFNFATAQVPSDWSATSTYSSGALVISDGTTYIAQQDVNTAGTALTDTSYWLSLDAAAPTSAPSTSAPTSTPDTSTVPTETPDTDTTEDVRLKGISTNATVTPTALMVAGVTITGGTKKVVFQVQATGTYGSNDGYLQDPVLYIVNSLGAVVATVDNWQDGPDAGYDTSLYSNSYLSELQNSSYAMAGANESAIIMNLPEGSYTALVGSKSGAETAKAVVAAFDFEE